MAEAAKDEPTMADILASVRRILADEEAGRIQPRVGERPLVLTNMLAADGSVFTIAPVPTQRPAPAPLPPNSFASLEVLKGRVATLLATDPLPEPAPSLSGAQGVAAVLKTAASALLPASILRRLRGTASDSALDADALQAPCWPYDEKPPATRSVSADLATDTVDPASLNVGPVAAWNDDGRRAMSTAAPSQAQAGRAVAPIPKRSRAPEAEVAPHDQPASDAGGTDIISAIFRPREQDVSPYRELPIEEPFAPKNQIELMLAQQLAAAHGAAMTLTGAAVHCVSDADDSRGGKNSVRESARLANSAARLMQAYTEGLTALALLRAQEQEKTTSRGHEISDTPQAPAPLAITHRGNRRGSQRAMQGARSRRRSTMNRAVSH